MKRLVQSVILAGLFGLIPAVWQPANAAEPLQNCVGLQCAPCEKALNYALENHPLPTSPNYLFVCGHESGGTLFVAFGYVGGTPNNIYADYDPSDNSCFMHNDQVSVDTLFTQMDRLSINAWKKSLRDVCRSY